MKRAILILVLGLLWCATANAEIIDITCTDGPKLKIRYLIDTSNKTVSSYWKEKNKSEQSEHYDLLEIDSVKAIYQGRGEYKKFKWQFNYGGDGLEARLEPEYKKLYYCKRDKGTTTAKSSGGSFTTPIGAHSATCKEIGFKPGTEKFGDCVLKLIELDIKRGGNVQAAEQFQRKRQDQGSQMLIELGLGLLSGSTTQTQINTNQRSTCRWQSGGIGQPYMTCITN